MSTSSFSVTTHTIPAAHIREFPRATTSAYIGVPSLKLVVNQYVPRNYTPKTGDLSIIFCHANGFHKVVAWRFRTVLWSWTPPNELSGAV